MVRDTFGDTIEVERIHENAVELVMNFYSIINGDDVPRSMALLLTRDAALQLAADLKQATKRMKR